MALSGVKPAAGLSETYREFKLERKYKYLILEIKGDVIDIKVKGPPDATTTDFVKALKEEKDFCYVVFSGDRRIGFLIYGPPESTFKNGMIYASSASTALQVLEGSYDCRTADDALDVLENLQRAGVI